MNPGPANLGHAAASPPTEAPFSIRAVAVIGAGRVGRAFALACAAAGFHIVLEDVMPANLRRAQEEYADLTTAHSDSDSDAHPSAGSLRVALTVEDAVRAADLAIDFVPDELESKLEIFCLVDRMAPPRTVLLTPSDALSITDLASCTYRPGRCFALRGWHPGDAFHNASPLRLLHPANAAHAALIATTDFLLALGANLQLEPDPDAPMLVKNYL